MKSATIALIMMLCSSGCAEAPSEAGKRLILPDIVVYPKALQKAAADEIEKNACPVQTELVKDYSVMRDQTRAAKKGLK
jgi:hypothetical protein